MCLLPIGQADCQERGVAPQELYGADRAAQRPRKGPGHLCRGERRPCWRPRRPRVGIDFAFFYFIYILLNVVWWQQPLVVPEEEKREPLLQQQSSQYGAEVTRGSALG